LKSGASFFKSDGDLFSSWRQHRGAARWLLWRPMLCSSVSAEEESTRTGLDHQQAEGRPVTTQPASNQATMHHVLSIGKFTIKSTVGCAIKSSSHKAVCTDNQRSGKQAGAARYTHCLTVRAIACAGSHSVSTLIRGAANSALAMPTRQLPLNPPAGVSWGLRTRYGQGEPSNCQIVPASKVRWHRQAFPKNGRST
jgi:hypothetical protein